MLLASRPLARLKDVEASLGRVEPVVLEGVVEELRSIADRGSVKRSRAARSALDYASMLRVVHCDMGVSVDEKIMNYAVEHGAAVATVDSTLRRRLRTAGVVVVTCRGNIVVVEGL